MREDNYGMANHNEPLNRLIVSYYYLYRHIRARKVADSW